jgi:hypothetical protein
VATGGGAECEQCDGERDGGESTHDESSETGGVTGRAGVRERPQRVAGFDEVHGKAETKDAEAPIT